MERNKAATEKAEGRKEAKRIKRVAAKEKERKKVDLDLAEGRAVIAALTEFEAVAKAAERSSGGRSRREDTHSREAHEADAEGVSLRPARTRSN